MAKNGKNSEPDRKARPWVTVCVVTQGIATDKYLVGWHKRHGWVFPGGRVNPFERLHDAAKREFIEETGMSLGGLSRLGVFEVIDEGADHHSIIVAYVGVVKSGTPKAKDDLGKLEYRALDELEQDDSTAEVTLRILGRLRPQQ